MDNEEELQSSIENVQEERNRNLQSPGDLLPMNNDVPIAGPSTPNIKIRSAVTGDSTPRRRKLLKKICN